VWVLAEAGGDSGYQLNHGRERRLNEKCSPSKLFDKLRCLDSMSAGRICCFGSFRQPQEPYMKDFEVERRDRAYEGASKLLPETLKHFIGWRQ
jgi:hypothetical protein